MKQAMKTQMKNVPEAEKEMLLDMVEKNPEFFENLAKELQEGLKAGKDQQTVLMELMTKHKDTLGKLMQK